MYGAIRPRNVASAGIQALAIPFCWLARRERMPADAMLAEGQEV